MNYSLFHQPEFVSVSDLQRNYALLLRELKKNQKPLLILKKNRLEAVLVPPDFFGALIQNKKQYEEQKALKAIGIYRQEKKARTLKKLTKIAELFE